MTVKVEAAPAVALGGALTTRRLAAAGLTTIPVSVPLSPFAAVSVTVSDSVPAVLKAVLKVRLPASAAVNV